MSITEPHDDRTGDRRIILFFSDHAPVRFTGSDVLCFLEIENAKLHPGFVSWDEIAGRS